MISASRLGATGETFKAACSPVLATGKEKVALAVEGEKGDLDNQNTQKQTTSPLKILKFIDICWK